MHAVDETGKKDKNLNIKIIYFKMNQEVAFFGAGCFWGVEEKFSKLKGVLETETGYMGGDDSISKISYGKICTGKTGHAETVKIIFDSDKLSYQDIIKVFWEIHNPTTLNYQGPDFGNQYRSVIFYSSDKQKEIALKSIKEKQKEIENRIVTQIVPATKFHRAEEYHQKYLMKNLAKSCHIYSSL